VNQVIVRCTEFRQSFSEHISLQPEGLRVRDVLFSLSKYERRRSGQTTHQRSGKRHFQRTQI
jgi:hypothetical protein